MASVSEKDFGSRPAELPPAVVGPSAWYGPEMADSSEWVYELTAQDLAEVEAAMAPLAAREADIAEIKQEDFELPTLGAKLSEICSEVINGRGFALIRGLPVDRWSIRQSATAYYGIGTHFGNARSQNGKGHILGHVRDLGRDAVNDPTARIYQTAERQTFHTDSCDIVALLCLKTAKSGGASALVSSMTIYNEMLKRRPDLLPYLFQPMHTDRRGEVPTGEKPWHDIPVFNWYEGHLSALYARRYIESARRFPEIPELTSGQREALDLFDELANDPAINMQMSFQPGDMQWVHNHTMLHDRTAFEDWPEPEKKRHLLRLWLAVPGARPLPPIYAQRFGTVDVGDRGGIIVPGSMMNAPLEPV
ncbi:MAG: TauD/TfdA family dioxygenase [Alphaproteobacteria bacterium]|nr:TauD/TfdA family dioxygenase [Alphaproteobacteria bacterium]